MRTDRPRARCTVLLWFVLAVAGCAGEETEAAPDIETRLVLKDAAGKESNAFQLRRDRITFAVIIRNRSDAPRTLTMPSRQAYDYVVYSGDNKEVWRWSAGRMFAQVITELTFAPGESRTFTATWDLSDRTGSPLTPGDYSAMGVVPGRVSGLTSSPVTFTIRPPESN